MKIQIQKGLPPAAEQIRTEVFIKEQGFCREFDEIDQYAFHFVLYQEEIPVAAARLFSSGGSWLIGRVAVRKPYRGLHLGSALMNGIVSFARNNGIAELILHSQEQAVPFYERFGFSVSGPGDEEGVPHRFMRLTLLPILPE